MIDFDFMPMAFEIYGACSEKFEDFLKKMVKSRSLFCVAELLEETLFSYSSTLNARLITQAHLVIFDNGGGNLERDQGEHPHNSLH